MHAQYNSLHTKYIIFIPCPLLGIICKFWRLLCSGQLLLFLVIKATKDGRYYIT